MIQKVIKYGNSLAVVLPKEIAAEVGLEAGDLVDTMVRDRHVEMYPVDMVHRISPADKEFVDALYQQREAVFKKLAE